MADYYNIAAILAEETYFPTTFNFGAAGLGRDLDPSCSTPDLEEGTEVELPLWLVKALAPRRMVTVGLPVAYGQRCGMRLMRKRRAAGISLPAMTGASIAVLNCPLRPLVKPPPHRWIRHLYAYDA